MNICVYLDGILYAERVWDSVPRVGDFISIYGAKKGIYRTDSVTWFGDGTPWVSLTLGEKISD